MWIKKQKLYFINKKIHNKNVDKKRFYCGLCG